MIKKLLLLSLLSFFILSASAQDKPNILWIVSEDNSPFLGCYGDQFATTPNLDKFAAQGIRYQNAFATAPVCAPSRNTLITGMYPPSLGTEHMRSTYPVPQNVAFFPKYLREIGYYTTNNAKKDYNTTDQPDAWDESSTKATYRNRKPGQPFFAVFNLNVSHESSIHTPVADSELKHSPDKVPLPPYHPATKEMKHDWAQYYDKIEAMDAQAGKLLAELDELGLTENTIVFYYADNGGVLGRSKRFVYESGLRVPLIVRFPARYRTLAPTDGGSVSDRLVTFLDFAPTILSLAGVEVPAQMQGKPFLGKNVGAEPAYAYGFRGRMDERGDLCRTVLDKQFRYIRNYMPHKIYGQYLEYLWKAPSMPSWEAEYKANRLNADQRRFWEEKPVEELYDIQKDPHNIHNLAGDPKYSNTLKKLREANRSWILQSRDVGFIPEAMIAEIAKQQVPFDFGQNKKYNLARILETAELASSRKKENLPELTRRLADRDAVVRYWAAVGMVVLGKDAEAAKAKVMPLLQDKEPAVRIAASEALLKWGESEAPVKALAEALQSDQIMARVQALNVLESIGAKAGPALPAVRALLKDNPADGDYDVRAARRVLETAGR